MSNRKILRSKFWRRLKSLKTGSLNLKVCVRCSLLGSMLALLEMRPMFTPHVRYIEQNEIKINISQTSVIRSRL